MANLLIRTDDGIKHSIPNPLTASAADRTAADRRLAFRLVTQATQAAQQIEPAGNIWFWYNQDDPCGQVFVMVAGTHLYLYRLASTDFPALPTITLSGRKIKPGMKLVLLSSENDPLHTACLAVRKTGHGCRLIRQQEIRADGIGFHMIALEITAPLPAASISTDGKESD